MPCGLCEYLIHIIAMIYRMVPKVKAFKGLPFGPLDLPLLPVQVNKLAMSDFSTYHALANPLKLFGLTMGNVVAGPGGASCNKK